MIIDDAIMLLMLVELRFYDDSVNVMICNWCLSITNCYDMDDVWCIDKQLTM